MRARTLLVLAAVAVAAAVLASLLDRRGAPQSTAGQQALLYPGMAAGINDIRRIEVGEPGSDGRLELEMIGTGWVVKQKSNYPADSGRIRQLLLHLSEARIVEPKTANPELYGRLGVADPGAQDGGTLLVVGPPTDLRLIVGRLETRAGSGTYVRRDGEAQSLLVGKDLTVAADPIEWLDKDIFDVDGDAITRMVVEHADGERLELVRVGERLVVAGIPEGRELSSPGASQPLTRGLSTLRFDDVVSAADFDQGEPDATVRYHLVDGRRITARAWRRDEASWVAFDVDLDPAEDAGPAGQQDVPEGQSDQAERDAGEAEAELERADPEAVARRDAELAGWVYRIPTYKFDQMVRRMEDLLRPVEG